MKLLQEIAQNKNIFKPVIYGLASTEISDEEKKEREEAEKVEQDEPVLESEKEDTRVYLK